jgi:predicted Zn-dependent protease
MKKYIVISVLVILGVVASLFLMPSTNEIGLMQLKDKRYDEARQNYEKKRAEGTLTVDVASALTDLYLQYGAVNDAIGVMEEFVQKNPNSIQAYKELGKLYQYAQRPDDYLRNLEVINKLEANKESLGTMVSMYGASQQYDKQEPALQLLVEHNINKEPHHYQQLANLQASEKRYADAVATLREFRTKFPESFKFAESELLVTLLLNQSKQEEAYTEAKQAAQQTQNPVQIARLINVLHYSGTPQLGWRLLEPYDAQTKEFPDLAAEKAFLLVNLGKRKEAYELMTWLNKNNKLPRALEIDYIALAIEKGDDETAIEIAKRIDVAPLNESQAVSVVELANYGGRSDLHNLLIAKFNDEELSANKPVLKALLAIVKKSPTVNSDIAALKNVEMSRNHEFSIASACATHQYTECVKTMLTRIESTKPEGKDAVGVANLYLSIGQIADARNIIDPLYEATPEDSKVSALRAKIAAYEGDSVFVDRWIVAQKEISAKDYKDLFFMAQDYNQTDTALLIAEKMHAAFNDTDSRTLLVNAYMAEKRYEEALPFLRELKNYSERDRNDYMAVLMDLSKKNSKYSQELASFAESELRGNLPARQKQALIYALLDAGRADIALPYIREFARTQGGDWVEVYAQNLDKLGRRDEARDFRLQIANDPKSSLKTRRDIGFVLLDKGYKEDSMSVFANLAADAPAKSTDVQQLLYLWGPRLTAEQLDWMTQRAINAPTETEKNQWIKYISGYADSDEMVALVDRNPDLIGDPVMLDTYLNSLYRLGKLDTMKGRVSKLAEKTSNTALLRAYARSTKGYNMTRLSQSTYKKLNEITAGDPESERNLGLMAFNQADYSETKKYLQNYVNFREKNKRYHADDYQAYFYLAESYRRDRKMELAEPYYRRSLELLSNVQGKRTGDMEARAAQSMVALGDKKSGYKIFEDALARSPQDDLLKADYLSTLIEEKDYAKAKALAATIKPDQIMATVSGDANPLMLKVSQLEGYRTFSGDNEMLLEFKGENDTRNAMLSPEELKNYPWLSYSTQGYDRALLVAKPNYQLKLEPTSGGYMVVPQADVTTASSDVLFRKELALRYKMLAARIDLETGRHYQATDELRKEIPANAQNGTLLGYAANAENFVGRWKRATRLLEEAALIMPENEDIQQLRRDIYLNNSQHAKIDYEWFKLGDSKQNIWTASGLKFIDDEIEVGGSVEYNDINARNIRRVDGRFGEFNEKATRAEIFVAKETEDGKRVQGSLFANDDFAGAGVYYGWYNSFGRSQVYGEYHRPNWDFVEGVIDSAVRDRVGVNHFIQIDPRWVLNGGFAVNRYHTADKTNVADSVSVSGVLTRQLKEVNPYLALNYALDAEYRTDNKKSVDAVGVSFEPLMQSREVHTASVIAADNLTEDTQGLIQAGYTYDRMTDANGPLIAGELKHQMLEDQLEAELRASYGAFTSDNVGDATRVGGYLKWRF